MPAPLEITRSIGSCRNSRCARRALAATPLTSREAVWEAPREYVKACAHTARLNADSAYDVVHAHYGHGGVVGRFSLRTPLVLSYTGSDLNGKPVSDTRITRRSRVEAAIFRRFAYLAA